MSDAPLVFYDEPEQKKLLLDEGDWKILVVDDDQDVHSVTEFVMHGVTILGRKLQFLHAFSAFEARELLMKEQDISVIILDVVMESEDAGLHLVKTVREELGLTATRIILRTGQPGYAPEYEAIRDYDINDYRTKSELSYARLLTSLTAAIRSYVQIKTIAENSKGLEFIISSAPELLRKVALDDFANEVLRRLQGLMAGVTDILFYMPDPEVRNSGFVIGAQGAFRDFTNKPWVLVSGKLDKEQVERITVAQEQRSNNIQSQWLSLYLEGSKGRSAILYAESASAIGEQQLRLLEVFGLTIAVGYRNLFLVNELRGLAFQDVSTGLLNRTGFIGALDALTDREGCVVALVDIEGFSEINEALGHDFGDELLSAVANRLETCFSSEVVIGRISADGFALLGDMVTVTSQSVLEAFSQPFQVKQNSLYLRVVCGMVRLWEVKGDGADIVKDAFIAVKQAKIHQLERFFYYNPAFEDEAKKKLGILDELKRALLEDRLEIHYQPQIQLDDGLVSGLEALIRWKNTKGEYVPPAVFIPLAEQSGLIVDVGDWVLRRVCRQVREWIDQGLEPIRYAVNVSVRQFKNPQFLERLSLIIKEQDLKEQYFEIEITESMAMHDVQEILVLLRQLKQRGFQIAIDDFGTGFSSLSYLQKLPIDRLKIDRSFVSGLNDNATDKALAWLIVNMGKSLGLAVIAEGVEIPEQSSILREMGCNEAQGYLYGKPMEPEAIKKLLREKQA